MAIDSQLVVEKVLDHWFVQKIEKNWHAVNMYNLCYYNYRNTDPY